MPEEVLLNISDGSNDMFRSIQDSKEIGRKSL